MNEKEEREFEMFEEARRGDVERLMKRINSLICQHLRVRHRKRSFSDMSPTENKYYLIIKELRKIYGGETHEKGERPSPIHTHPFTLILSTS